MCGQIHALAHRLPRYRFPYDEKLIPADGIYLLFEAGELAHEGDRIVRVGTHTAQHKLPSRLRKHFANNNKNSSIFRKNIGRALLNRADDPPIPLSMWNKKPTPAEWKPSASLLEQRISEITGSRFTIVTISVPQKNARLELEASLIATISQCEECSPSANWLGLASPKPKIKNSGLWQEQHLLADPMTSYQLNELRRYAGLGDPTSL